jgi:hypothetical protein
VVRVEERLEDIVIANTTLLYNHINNITTEIEIGVLK